MLKNRSILRKQSKFLFKNMRSFSKYWKLFLAIFTFAVLIFFRQSISSGLSRAKLFLSDVSTVPFSRERVLALETEIALLRDEVRRLEDISNKSSGDKKSGEKFKFKESRFYFIYPFSGKKTVILDYGRHDGADLNMPVLFRLEDRGEFILIGKITKVEGRISEVSTIFDPSWTSGVFVGPSRIRAVLRGGSLPELDLVSGDAVIKKGDVVFNASPDIPIDIPIGVIDQVSKKNNTNLAGFPRVQVKPFFSPDSIQKAVIITDFP